MNDGSHTRENIRSVPSSDTAGSQPSPEERACPMYLFAVPPGARDNRGAPQTSSVALTTVHSSRKSWKTPKVRDAIRKRNRLSQFAGTRRTEWLAARL